MKRYKQILCVLGGLLVLTLGVLLYLVHKSGTEEQRKDKQTAEMLLKDAAVAWVSQELEQQGIPFSSGGGNDDVKSSKRRIVTAAGPLIVEVDSVKEEKRLLSSDLLASMVRYLLVPGNSSIDELNKQWQRKLDTGLPYYYSVLEFIPQMPNNKKNLQQAIAGNPSLCLPENKLGDYYLDNMYFLEVKAYLSAPSVWWCADWRRIDIVLCIGGLVLGICILAFLLIYNRNKIPDDKVDTLPSDVLVQPDEVLSSDKIVSEDEVVCCLGNGRYQLREILFDEFEMTITFREQVKQCPKQSYKLLSAFIHAEDHFLSNNRIIEICGWNLTDIGVNNKKRTAISQLRKWLESSESCVNIVAMRNEEYGEGFELLITD
ncbi:MAG: hypothetical protein EGQ20_00930 [Bacteroides oleiciplenus]|nr:hypothetical protein [Bacteroides oleiciplenus]